MKEILVTAFRFYLVLGMILSFPFLVIPLPSTTLPSSPSLSPFHRTSSTKLPTTPSPPSCDMTADEQSALFNRAMTTLNTTYGWILHDTGIMRYTRGNAYGNNPSSLYGIYEWLNPFNFPVSWLGPQDAWVWIGCTPPLVRYFSSRSYLYSSPLLPNQTTMTYSTASSFTTLFASLGDSNNILTINTTAGGPCNRTAVIITTADEGTAVGLSTAFINAGLDPGALNIDIVPSSLGLIMGRNLSTDLFTYLFRVALFNDTEAGDRYTSSIWPVYYVYPPSTALPQPFPLPSLRPRDNRTNEFMYNTSLFSITQTIASFWINKGSTLLNTQSCVPLLIEGYECIATNTCCLGDNRDTSYVTSSVSYLLPDDHSTFLTVTGVNHVLTMDVIYANLDVNDDITGDGVIGVTNDYWYGSVQHYVPTIDNSTVFYAYAIARNCSLLPLSLPYCLEVNLTALPSDHGIVVAERAYLQRTSKVGPSDSALLMPIVMQFTLPPPS